MTTLAIATHNLTRRFGAQVAVDSLELAVPHGSIYGFLGPNGAGKSTTIRMLLGLIRPHAGEVQLLPEQPDSQRAALARVGALVESPSLYPHLTGHENLEVTRRLLDVPRARLGYLLELVDLQAAAHRPVRTYSQGMKQRLGLALAMLNAPDLLILDEPTNGLDPAGIREMRALVRRLQQEEGITIFLSSHLLNEVEQVATHLGIIQEGRLRFQGTLDDLHAQMEGQVVLEVDQPERAKSVLQAQGWTLRSNGSHRLSVVANGKSDAALLNAQLTSAGVNVYTLSLAQPTLEDIFFSLTESNQ